MQLKLRKFVLFGFIKILLCTSANTQSKIVDNFYAEASIGTSILNTEESDYFHYPSLSFSVGSKIISSENVFFDLSFQYAELRTKNIIYFVEPYGTVVNKNNLKNLQIGGIVGYQINNFSFGAGIASYFTLQSKSELLREYDSFIINSESSFSTLRLDSNYKNFGFSVPFELGYIIAENMELKFNMNFIFIEGITPINNRGLRYLYITNFGVTFRRYL